jgi:GT2 family glycosyltransferase
MKNIAVLVTCHNRKEKTIACINAIYKCKLPDGFAISVILVDDGSTDGTSQAVKVLLPPVVIINGDGNLFWNGGMRLAFVYAMSKKFDYYLWLNDDTLLYRDTISRAITTVHELPSNQVAVAVGTTQSSHGGHVTYGGLVRVGKGLSYKSILVEPSEKPIQCEQMNGNCVLIPDAIAKVVGNLDKHFVHNLGDIDYGMRVRAAGFKLLVIPGFAGTCEKNSPAGSHLDGRLTFRARMKSVLSVKAFPLVPWFVFTWRHAGPLWFLYWIKPYFDVVVATFKSK